MSPADLLWFPPLLLAIALVLGASGRTGAREIARASTRAFVNFGLGIAAVGVVVRVVVVLLV